MQNGFQKAKVRLSGNQIPKFMQRIQSDPQFSQKFKQLMQTGNENRIATFLKNNGFRLG